MISQALKSTSQNAFRLPNYSYTTVCLQSSCNSKHKLCNVIGYIYTKKQSYHSIKFPFQTCQWKNFKTNPATDNVLATLVGDNITRNSTVVSHIVPYSWCFLRYLNSVNAWFSKFSQFYFTNGHLQSSCELMLTKWNR